MKTDLGPSLPRPPTWFNLSAVIKRILHRLTTGGPQQRPADPVDRQAFSDLSPQEIATLVAARPFTMTSPERIAALINAVTYVVRHRIPGDIVECGVWRGGSMVAIARTLLELGDTSRELYLYDTFEGMPPPSAKDRDRTGVEARQLLEQTARDSDVWAIASLEDARRNVLSTGYPAEKIHFIAGKVEDTIPRAAPAAIALLRLDTDWYESTRHELLHLYPRLAKCGLLVIDDYGHWQGARAAVDEFFQQSVPPVFLHRIDYTGRLVVKP